MSNDGKKYSAFKYTVDHIKSLYPHYIFSLIIMFAYYIVKNIYYIVIESEKALTIIDLIRYGYERIPELFLVQNIGFFDGGMNYPLWQMSCLIICGYFIYAFLCNNERFATTILFPLSIIFIQVYMLTISSIWEIKGIVYVPFIRAFSAMCIGVLTYRFTRTECYEEIVSKYVRIFNMISIVALVGFLTYTSHKNIYLILSAIIILALNNADSWLNKIFNKKSFKSFGNLSYALYLNHALIIWIFNDFLDEYLMVGSISLYVIRLVLYGVILTIYSVITTSISKKLFSVNK